MKYDGAVAAASVLAPAMADSLIRSGLAARADIAVPVPLHPSRLRERGYNQAELLADLVCTACGLPMAAEALERISGGRTQVGGTGADRRLDRGKTFEANPVFAAGKKVLIIDDVYTTGRTAQLCAAALRNAGALEACVLTATRSLYT